MSNKIFKLNLIWFALLTIFCTWWHIVVCKEYYWNVSLWSEDGLGNTSLKCDCNTRFDGAKVHSTLVNSKALKYFDIRWSFSDICITLKNRLAIYIGLIMYANTCTPNYRIDTNYVHFISVKRKKNKQNHGDPNLLT